MGAHVEWESLPWAMVVPPPGAASPGIISMVSIPSVFIRGLRPKGLQLPGRSSFPGCVGGTGESTHLRGHIASLSFLF